MALDLDNLPTTDGLWAYAVPAERWVDISALAVPQQVQDLAIISQSSSTLELLWTEPQPGINPIAGYEIEYRIFGAPTWTNYAGNPVTGNTYTLTGLVPLQDYEVQIRAIDTSGLVAVWSNIAQGRTAPDIPLFDPTLFSLANVGGAGASRVVAMEDGTVLELNGSPVANLNAGDIHTFTGAQGDVLSADKPIAAGGNRSNSNIVWQPPYTAGFQFSFNATRSNPQQLLVYAWEPATVTLNTPTASYSQTLAAGASHTFSWSEYGSYQLSATGLICAFHYSSTGVVDPKPLLPATSQMIGFPSNSGRLTSTVNSNSWTGTHSNGALISGITNINTISTLTPQGTGSYYRCEALLIDAAAPVTGASYADSNGSCAAPFLPTVFQRAKFALPVNSDWVAFASDQPGTITRIDPSGATVGTLTLTGSGPYKAYIGPTSNIPAGTRFESSVPCGAWYQPNTSTGAGNDDESILFGAD